MTGEKLEADRGAGEEEPAPIALARPRFEAEEDPGCPGHGAEIGKMAGENMWKNGAGKRHDHPGQPGGPGLKAAIARPALHAETEKNQMEQDRKIKRRSEGKDNEEEIGRIENRRLEAAEEWLAAIGVGIPKRNMAVAQAVGQEGAPGDKLGGHVGIPAGQERAGWQDENQRECREHKRANNECCHPIVAGSRDHRASQPGLRIAMGV